jgi:hypothetical protein
MHLSVALHAAAMAYMRDAIIDETNFAHLDWVSDFRSIPSLTVPRAKGGRAGSTSWSYSGWRALP